MPPPPPPPPPPGPGPPGPPPPPMMGAPGPKMTAMPDRKGLLGDIAKGKQLKKAVTNDRSAPTVGGGVVSNSSAPRMGKPPTIPGAASGRISSAPEVDPSVSSGGPQLAGIFAGGMPTLKKTSNGIRTNTLAEVPASQSLRSVSSPAARPPSVPGGLNRNIPPAPGHRPNNSMSSPTSAPPAPPPAPPAAPAPPLPTSTISMMKTAAANAIPMKPGLPPPIARKVNSPLTSTPPAPPPARPLSNPPSLPTAPPPPLPSAASPMPPASRASLQPLVRTITPPPAVPTMPAPPPPAPVPPTYSAPQPSASMTTASPVRVSSYSQAPPPPPPPPAMASTNSSLNGLQAALASRSSSQTTSSRPSSMPSSVLPTSNGLNAATTPPSSANYSLKPQHVKRVDDSKYKFQPDNALPTVRPFTGSHKAYKSGRAGGSTVPLNLEAYR